MVENCPRCGMRTEMPERHQEKYEEVHRLMEEEGFSLRDALVVTDKNAVVEE